MTWLLLPWLGVICVCGLLVGIVAMAHRSRR
jgi:hypothetical protein